MNYRHAYHAGNHADVLKHIVVARIVEHLKKTEKPFRCVDLHAGIGIYELHGVEAQKTLEWREGVGRLYDSAGNPVPLSPEAELLLAPWRQAIAALNMDGIASYPGSPEIVRQLMRREDRLNLNELHPIDAETLRERYGRDRQVSITQLDAAIAIKSQLPPPERRGLVLVDPPYEVTDEIERIIVMLSGGLKRFANGIYCIWYPVTGDGLDARITDALRTMSVPEGLRIELRVRRARMDGGLSGSGMIVLNPPWHLDTELAILLPELCERLGQDEFASAHVSTLAAG